MSVIEVHDIIKDKDCTGFPALIHLQHRLFIYTRIRDRKGGHMRSKDELVLKTAKEIVVKFIEVGNISPSSFHDHFKKIYETIEKTVHPENRQQQSER